MSAEHDVSISMELQEGMRFLVDFRQEGVPPLLMDEPEPLGEGTGPNAARLLAAAIGNCLSASALFCLRKARIDVHGMRTKVDATLERNDTGRLRVTGVQVHLQPVVDEDQQPRMRRCLEVFEDFCVVTQSVRGGVDVSASVEPVTRQAAAAQ